jgi:hypothetical protein
MVPFERMSEKADGGIASLTIKGFKSLAEAQTIEVRPLTFLAGANSSGKSSALQPLLLLKQTLEASYDPGPLLLDGPHVRFTSAEQLLAKTGRQRLTREFEISIAVDEPGRSLSLVFQRHGESFKLARMATGEAILEPGMPMERLKGLVPGGSLTWKVERERCFLVVRSEEDRGFALSVSFSWNIARQIRSIIHVSGLRGNPARSYPTSAVGEFFSGPFEPYVASIIASWQHSDDTRLQTLGEHMRHLGLTWGVKARSIDATQVELLVGRLSERGRSGKEDLVNIADVGFGVSQVLPILVALLVAKPDQLVYLEQPEIHLHPRAQEALASVLAEAVGRGVRVVAETHSSLLLLALQTVVAKGELSSKNVKLHWFRRDARGATRIDSADLDDLGAYGDWPEDFGSVSSEADHRYLSAVEKRAFRPARNAKK